MGLCTTTRPFAGIGAGVVVCTCNSAVWVSRKNLGYESRFKRNDRVKSWEWNFPLALATGNYIPSSTDHFLDWGGETGMMFFLRL